MLCLAMIILASAVLLVDARIGLSLMWGFSACMLPALSFAWYASRGSGTLGAVVTINRFYRAEAVKIVLTAALFALIFQHEKKIDVVVLFLAFIVAQVCSSVLVARTLNKSSR